MRPDGKLRLPPGQHLTTGWPVLHYGSIPRIDLDSWRFHVWGLVEEEKSFTWDEFNALGTTTELNDIHCVTTWSKYDNTWEGVPFAALLDQVKLKPEANFAMLHSYGGYTTNVPLADSRRPGDVATKHDGEELTKNTDGRCASLSHTSTSGRAPNGSAESSSSNATTRLLGNLRYHIYGDPCARAYS